VFWATFLSTLDFADFDLDGDPDILITGSISGAQFAAQVYENAGSNSFIPADTLVPAYRTSTAIADLDGDTDPDLVILGITNASNPFRTIAYDNTAMVVAVKGPDAAQATQAWPNPTAGLVHIDSGREGRQQLLLYNAAGELVFQTKANARGITLDLQPYSPGIYVAKVIPEGSPAGFIKLIRGDTRYVNSR